MGEQIETIRRILFIDLPSLPIWAKSGVSVIIITCGVLVLLFLWKNPSTVASLDPTTSQRLEQGVVAFFRNEGEIAASKAIVFGEAKAIVRRMKNEPDVFAKIQMEIESRKKNDNNWMFANQLNEASALVNALGLTTETSKENQIFLQMPLPLGVQSQQH
jgi:hypothetical protein